MKKEYKNGYSDGSGKGTITLNNEPFLRTHWGCSCCDYGPTRKEVLLATKIAKILNEHIQLNKEQIKEAQEIKWKK